MLEIFLPNIIKIC